LAPKPAILEVIERLHAFRAPAGGFARFAGGRRAWDWGTLYATHLAVELARSGHRSDEDLIRSTVEWIAARAGDDRAWPVGLRAYATFVLALARHPEANALADALERAAPDRDGRGPDESRILLALARFELGEIERA